MVSKNPYLRLLVKLYNFLARRTNANFNKIIAKRLIMPKRYRPPLSLSKLQYHMANHPNDIAVVVGSITGNMKKKEKYIYIYTYYMYMNYVLFILHNILHDE